MYSARFIFAVLNNSNTMVICVSYDYGGFDSFYNTPYFNNFYAVTNLVGSFCKVCELCQNFGFVRMEELY